tara:strand:- start:1427 stop:1852 length:426 start_codon:yes stop_codon:yes gene_type:complete
LGELSIFLLAAGTITLCFGFLLVFYPSLVLRTQMKANQLFLTDSFIMKYRISFGLACSFASLFLFYVFFSSVSEHTFLIIGVISAIYGIMLMFSPRSLLTLERHANLIYVTDDFFFKNKNAVGIVMIALSIFMLYSYAIIN